MRIHEDFKTIFKSLESTSSIEKIQLLGADHHYNNFNSPQYIWLQEGKIKHGNNSWGELITQP